MKLYARLAVGGIRRNGKFYAPYIMTCSLMAMMFYIVNFLHENPMLETMSGGDSMMALLSIGIVIMGLFAALFLFYTNSFLIRRRKREFGLYNILGMGKRNIAAVMTWETLFVYLLSMVLGVGAGILFSKLAELLALRIIRGEAQYQFSVSVNSIVVTLIVFAAIFLLIYMNVLRQVFFSKPIELLHSENSGEKPPRANWFLAVLGSLTLGVAYYMAVTIKEPMRALFTFMLAVMLVIAATYMLFIAGSVVICKALQKNRRYYYRTNHFVSVSQMAYRMKKNGAGLASICILSTMVLVTLSSTICLYIGEEDMLTQRYPREIVMSLSEPADGEPQELRGAVAEILEKHSVSASNELGYSYVYLSGTFIGNKVDMHNSEISDITGDYRSVYVVPVEDYNALYGTDITLSDGEAVMYLKGSSFSGGEIQLDDWGSFRIVKQLDEFTIVGMDSVTVTDSIYLFVNDPSILPQIYKYQINIVAKDGGMIPHLEYYYGFDLGCGDDTMNAVYSDIIDFALNDEMTALTVECRSSERDYFYGTYGGLFFLGIIFGAVFILAAVLIMYYKQISEGYDDRARFDILRKVGMNDREIRRAVNSQVLTVFFAPLIAAGVHMAFAFPLLMKMLGLFGMRDTAFLAAVTVVCYCIFAMIYVLMYGVTSRSYYRIVCGRKS